LPTNLISVFSAASSGTDGVSLTMRDQSEHETFRAESNDLHMSSDEEEVPILRQGFYELARGQALKSNKHWK
jgi:hypothetical protein